MHTPIIASRTTKQQQTNNTNQCICIDNLIIIDYKMRWDVIFSGFLPKEEQKSTDGNKKKLKTGDDGN